MARRDDEQGALFRLIDALVDGVSNLRQEFETERRSLHDRISKLGDRITKTHGEHSEKLGNHEEEIRDMRAKEERYDEAANSYHNVKASGSMAGGIMKTIIAIAAAIGAAEAIREYLLN